MISEKLRCGERGEVERGKQGDLLAQSQAYNHIGSVDQWWVIGHTPLFESFWFVYVFYVVIVK